MAGSASRFSREGFRGVGCLRLKSQDFRMWDIEFRRFWGLSKQGYKCPRRVISDCSYNHRIYQLLSPVALHFTMLQEVYRTVPDNPLHNVVFAAAYNDRIIYQGLRARW